MRRMATGNAPASERRRSGRWIIGATLLASAVITSAGHGGVQACSLAPAPNLDDLRPGEPAGDFDTTPVTGVYEYETVARAPGWFGDRSVTIVTRYWGDAPDHTGRSVVTPGCGRTVSDAGTVGYWWVSTSERRFRSSMTLRDASGTLTAEQESALAERFGPPRVLDVSRLDRMLAAAQAWQWELLALAGSCGVAVLLVVRVRRQGPVGRSAPDDGVVFDASAAADHGR